MNKLLSAVFVLTSFFAIYLSPLWADTSPCESHSCIAVVDAGSTGSRLHVYTYDMDTSSTPTEIAELYQKQISPGLATLALNASTVDAYFTELFSAMPKGKMPIYIYSTAGMRLLSNAKQAEYYKLIGEWIKNKPQLQLIEAKTITGQDEGIFGWLSVNYKLGRLQSSDKSLVGVMDMGGASVQISFPMKDEQPVSSEEVVEIDVYGRHIELFSHSFLGLGQNEVMHQYLNEPSCFSPAYVLPDGLLGIGDAYRCADRVSLLLNVVHQVKDIIQAPLSANPVSDWYTIGGLSYLATSKPFDFEQDTLSSAELIKQGNERVCQDDAENMSGTIAQNERAYSYCLVSSYYYALMFRAYGISESTPIHYIPHNEGVDWTLGVVLRQQEK